MHTHSESTAVWSFVVPAAALVITWLVFGPAYNRDSARPLMLLAVVDAAAAAAGLILVSRSKPVRGWAVAGAVTSVVVVLAAIGLALLAALIRALSGLTF